MAGKRFTLYDSLAEAGVFDLNPANATARNYETGEILYKGPVEFPKMFYHPKGDQREIVPANYASHPVKGVIETDRQVELISALAEGPEDEKRLRAEGWHESPEDANAVREGREARKMPQQKVAAADDENAKLRAQIAALEAEKAALQAAPPAPPAKPSSKSA